MNLLGTEDIHLKDYGYILRKRKKVFVLFFILVMIATLIFTVFEKVLYRATSTILIERENPNVVDFKEVMAMDAASTEYYQTQYQKIKSHSLIQTLFKENNLTKDPYLISLTKGRLRHFLKTLPFLPKSMKRFLADPYPEDVLIKSMLKVQPVRNTRLVEVSILYPDPIRSADLTNSLVNLFIKRNLQDRFLVSRQATQLISDQLFELKQKVAEAQRKLQQYKEEQGLVNIPSIREKDIFLQEAKLELVKLQSEKSKLAKRYLADHPKMIHLISQIEGLEQKINEEEQKILSAGRTAIDYAELEREAESSRQIYEALLKRLEETTSEAQSQASNVSIVDDAKVPLKPYTPRPILNFVIAVFLGSIGGVFLVFFLEYLDSSIKIPDDIEQGLGLPLLGIIPKAEKNPNTPYQGELFFNPREPSTASESLRALRTSLLMHLRQVPGCRVILLTSPNPEEGKSTIIFNLASAIEQNHLKVLLIDADLRKPRLHQIMEVSQKMGLAEVLEGEATAQDVIHKNLPGLGFDFLSCGNFSNHPTEILGSDRMASLIQELKKNYDFILMDSPPYLAVADVIVLSEYSHAVIVIAKYHKTDRKHIKGISQRFSKNKERLCGVIINQVSVREKDYYYHQYYYYGYGNDRPKK